MIYIDVPEKNRLTSFYLATEEYVARHIADNEDYFFI